MIFVIVGYLFFTALTDTLDFKSPSSPKEFARLCAKDTGANYCSMIHWAMTLEKRPLVVIFPHDYGSTKLNERLYADLNRYEKQHAVSFRGPGGSEEALFKANAFALSELTTGTHQTLDGQDHQVICDGPQSCTIDGLAVRGANQTTREGRAYFSQSSAQPYLPLPE